jgi:hypothetical protein
LRQLSSANGHDQGVEAVLLNRLPRAASIQRNAASARIGARAKEGKLIHA